MVPIDLGGRVALVTASSRGIGRTIALMLADAGADVAINYRNDVEAAEEVKRSIEAKGVKAVAIQADVTSTAEVAAMVEQARAALGHIDIVVNNAGVGVAKGASELTDEEFQKVFDVNVRAYMALVRSTLPAMKEKRAGRIVVVSSVAGRSGKAFVGTSPAYAGAKGAAISFTRSLARECGPFNITANAVCPGWIDWEGIPRKVAPEVRERAISEMPLGRVGNDRDVAGAVLFLVSDLASYVTGVSLDVNGGLYMA